MIFDSFRSKKTDTPSPEVNDVSLKKKHYTPRLRPTQKRKKVVHTKRSFHRPLLRPVSEQVRVFDVLDRPIVTEKASQLSGRGVYLFFVRPFATKHSVHAAVEAVYGVSPAKVRIARYPKKRKRVRVRGRERELSSPVLRKRAYVFLKEGDKIQLS